MKWSVGQTWCTVVVGLCVVVIVAMLSISHNCPDYPEPVVDTVYIDSFYSFSRGDSIWVVTCTDSIAVLNDALVERKDMRAGWFYVRCSNGCSETIDSLKRLLDRDTILGAIPATIDSFEDYLSDPDIISDIRLDPCAGLIEAVVWVVSVDLEDGFVASQEFTDSLEADRDFVRLTELMAGNDSWFTVKHGSARFGGRGFNISTMRSVRMQRLKEGRR